MDKLYTKTTWVNDSRPALNADNLNNIENGIDAIDSRLVTVGNSVATLNNGLSGLAEDVETLETNLGDLKKDEVDKKIESEIATDFSQADTPAFQQTIDDIQTEVDKLNDILLNDNTNVISYSVFNKIGYVLYSDGTINTQYGSYRTDYIDISDCSRIIGKGKINNAGCIIAFYNKDKTYLKTISISGASGGASELSFDVDLQNKNAHYAIVSYFGVPDESCNIILHKMVSKAVYEVNEIYNHLGYKNGIFSNSGYIGYSDGIAISNSGARYTDYIFVRGCYQLEVSGCINNSGCIVAFYDKNKTYLKDVSICGSSSGASESHYTIDLSDDKYKNVYYAIVSWFGMGTIKNAYLRTSNADDNPLKNKVINVVGDSITSVDYEYPNWWQMISSDTHCIVNDYGWSGTTLAHTDDKHLWGANWTKFNADTLGYNKDDPTTWSGGGCIVERTDRLNSSADCVIVMGGTNDTNVPKGSWNSRNTDTFFGALNVLMEDLIEKFSGKLIVFCTPIQTKSAYSSNVMDALKTLEETPSTSTLSIQLRAECIKAKCNQYGIPCIDLYNESGINGADANGVYYRTNDTLHPSAIGQKRIKSIVQSKLEDYFR